VLTPYPMGPSDIWAIWANHDCANWEILLTFVMTREATSDVIAQAGVEYSELGCQRLEADDTELDQCQFRMKVNGDNFALLFKDGFTPIWYDIEWVYLGDFQWTQYFFPW